MISGCILMQATTYQSDEQDNSRTKVFWWKFNMCVFKSLFKLVNKMVKCSASASVARFPILTELRCLISCGIFFLSKGLTLS